jgi:hypothetical protein
MRQVSNTNSVLRSTSGYSERYRDQLLYDNPLHDAWAISAPIMVHTVVTATLIYEAPSSCKEHVVIIAVVQSQKSHTDVLGAGKAGRLARQAVRPPQLRSTTDFPSAPNAPEDILAAPN